MLGAHSRLSPSLQNMACAPLIRTADKLCSSRVPDANCCENPVTSFPLRGRGIYSSERSDFFPRRWEENVWEAQPPMGERSERGAAKPPFESVANIIEEGRRGFSPPEKFQNLTFKWRIFRTFRGQNVTKYQDWNSRKSGKTIKAGEVKWVFNFNV